MVSLRSSSGFSLLEVLVAFAILSLSLGVILQIFSTGLRSASLGEQYTRAVALAETKLTEIESSEVLREGDAEGEFDQDFRWHVTVRLAEWWEQAGGETLPVWPYELIVEVLWGDAPRERSVTLATLRPARPE